MNELKGKIERLERELAQARAEAGMTAPSAEPVAYMTEYWSPDCGEQYEIFKAEDMGWRDKSKYVPLYAVPQPAPSAEPVAYMTSDGLVASRRQKETNTACTVASRFTIPLYAAPQPDSGRVDSLVQHLSESLGRVEIERDEAWEESKKLERDIAHQKIEISDAHATNERLSGRVAELEAEIDRMRQTWDSPAGIRASIEAAVKLTKERDEARAEVEKYRKDAERLGELLVHARKWVEYVLENQGRSIEGRRRSEWATELLSKIDAALAAKGE